MDDYYSENEESAPESMVEDVPAEGQEGMDEQQEDSGSETALLSKSMFGGKQVNVGDEFVFKVAAIHDDQVEIEYAPEKKDEGEESSTGNSMERMQPYADKP